MPPEGSNLAPLRGDVDIQRLLRMCPPAHTIKGAFIAPNALAIASDWPGVEPTLRAPPRGGKYLTFSDYPFSDHLLLSDLAARAKYPGIPTCEAHRLLTRSTMDIFSNTTLG